MKLTFSPNQKNKGERTGLVVMGRDYAGLVLENTDKGLVLSQVECDRADKGKPEEVKAAVDLSGMPEEIEECMDDVFLDVWNNIDRFDESKGSFRSWITAIARFRSIDYLRRYSRRCSEEDIADYENKLANDNLLEILNEEISDSMEKLLGGLSDEDRDIILRYYWDDQCVDEIAEDYGVSSSSIYSRMSRARSRLKQV